MGNIAELLKRGTYCAINTGRAYDRIRDEFVKPFQERFPDVSLDKFFVVTEMGGEATMFKGGQAVSQRTHYSLSNKELNIFNGVWKHGRHDNRHV